MTLLVKLSKRVSVNWDTDNQQTDLPDIVEVPNNMPEEEIADWLSDQFGWCVNSFSILEKNKKE